MSELWHGWLELCSHEVNWKRLNWERIELVDANLIRFRLCAIMNHSQIGGGVYVSVASVRPNNHFGIDRID